MSKQVQESDVGVAGKSRRILALDLLRGFFLLVIMIDHIELFPNGFDFFTGKGRLFVSAAEGFFFMSGLLIGMVYKRRLHLGMKFIFMKMWKRAAQLYLASIFFTLLFVVWAVVSNHPAIKYGLPVPLDWHWIIKETLLMRYGFGWADFLMRFAILMFFAPFIFYLAAKRKWWLALIIIGTAWALRGENFSLGWQIIFNGGILIGFYWQQLSDWYRKLKPQRRKVLNRTVITITAITFAYSYVSTYGQSLLNHYYYFSTSIPIWLKNFTFHWNSFNDWIWLYAQKWTMGPLRVFLFFCWFSVLYVLVRRHEIGINRKTRGVLELLGRNSLFVYIAHAFIVFIVKFFIPLGYTNFFQNFFYTTIGIILLVLTTVVYQLLRSNPIPKSLPEAKNFVSKGRSLLAGNS